MTLLQGLFVYLAAVIIATSVLAVTRRHPVHSVLWMLVVFVHIAVLYLFLHAEFLAVIQLIIYAGAVLVLFLFVLMLLNLRPPDMEGRFQRHWGLGAALAASFLALLAVTLARSRITVEPGSWTMDLVQQDSNIRILGKVLFTDFLLPFEIASLILLVAILGAVVLALKRAS